MQLSRYTKAELEKKVTEINRDLETGRRMRNTGKKNKEDLITFILMNN